MKPTNLGTATITLASGREVTATLAAYVTDDQFERGDVAFGDDQADADYEQRFETGELLSVCIEVRATYEGIKGNDYLGKCHVHAAQFESDVVATIVDYDMVERATSELAESLNALCVKLCG